jgi:hypothetical protein
MVIHKIAIRLRLCRTCDNPDADGQQTSRGCEKDDRGKPAHSLMFAIRDPQSTIDNSTGGIAQLVERQLCKLEVRGSNPLASNSPESEQ